MSIFQISAVLFALCMLYVVNIHKRKAALSVIEVAFWYTTWIVFIVIALFPHLLMGIAGALRFARVFDLLIVTALMILTITVIRSYFGQKESHKKLDELIRKQALEQHAKSKKKK